VKTSKPEPSYHPSVVPEATLEDNGAVNAGIRMMGAKLYKTYRVYDKSLEAASHGN